MAGPPPAPSSPTSLPPTPEASPSDAPPGGPDEPGEDSGPSPSRRPHLHLWQWIVFSVAGILVLALILGASIHVDYYAIGPGGTFDTTTLISVPGGKGYPSSGEVAFPTVSQGRVTALGAVRGWLDPDVDVIKANRIVPPKTTDSQVEQFNQQLMDNSKEKSTAVALEHLGYTDAVHGTGAQIVQVLPGSAAAGSLASGDVIVAVDGKPVTLDVDAVDAVSAKGPGDTVHLTVRNAAGATREVVVTLGKGPSDPKRGFLGVTLQTADLAFKDPFPVKIDSEQIVGPSAGLAFTLEVLDQLTPGELTGGHRVAATGTMELDGRVGDVGGVPQKTASVVSGHYDLFLVPSGEYAQARQRAGSKVKVVAVDTLDQALAALSAIGGNALALQPLPAA